MDNFSTTLITNAEYIDPIDVLRKNSQKMAYLKAFFTYPRKLSTSYPPVTHIALNSGFVDLIDKSDVHFTSYPHKKRSPIIIRFKYYYKEEE